MQDYYHYQEPDYQATRKRGVGGYIITGAIALILGVLLAVMILPGALNYSARVEPPAAPAITAQQLKGTSQDTSAPLTTEAPQIGSSSLPFISGDNPIVDIAHNVGPSVVGIVNKVNSFSRGRTPTEQARTSGSGIIISEDGYIVTNNHVVEGGDALYVTMDGGDEIKAALVGADPYSDLAVLKIDKTGLSPAALADSSKVQVGEVAVAIGNPLGSELSGTVTVGFISAVDRTINVSNHTLKLIQTDAAINPGNSGGALVNIKGEVIGINTLKSYIAGYDEMGNIISTEGIGFAIPINEAKPIIEQLIKNGGVVRPGIGVTVYEMKDEDAENWNAPKGIMVMSVTANAPADVAGIRVNDIILAYDGITADKQNDLIKYLQSKNVGDEVKLKIWRTQKEYEVTVRITDINNLSIIP